MGSVFKSSKPMISKMKSFIRILALYLIPPVIKSQGDGPVVNTLTGLILGKKDKTLAGTEYYKFLGIPYAEAPVDELRFKDPVKKQPWHGILNTTEFSAPCLQKTFIPGTPSTLLGSEDCLYLNVATPNLDYNLTSKDPMPVMFWIHGGGFVSGSGSWFDPSFLLDKDVLIVSLNYRLGPFGFLALEKNTDLAGNIGLKDQQEALHWVSKNIIYFGGDPTKVTLFGESAGALSAHAHVLSPRINDTFHGAILQSGSLFTKYVPAFIEKEVQKNSKKLIEKIKCNVNDIIECLQEKDAETLLELPTTFDENDLSLTTSYWIVQDHLSKSPVLPLNPLQQSVIGNVKKVPMISGITKNDGTFFLLTNPTVKTAVEKNDLILMMKTMGLALEHFEEEGVNIANIMKRFYLSEGSFEANMMNVIEMQTDSWFWSPSSEVTKLHSKVAPVYPYVLNERCTEISWSTFFGGGNKDFGVSHIDDVSCIFKSSPPYEFIGDLTVSGSKVSQAMVGHWTNFAKFKNPSPHHCSEPRWPQEEIMFYETDSGLKNNETDVANLKARALLWERLWWGPLEKRIQPEA